MQCSAAKNFSAMELANENMSIKLSIKRSIKTMDLRRLDDTVLTLLTLKAICNEIHNL